MAKTYISYSSTDRAFVSKLATDLKNNNIDIWIDIYEIQPGEMWLNATEKAIKDATTLIFVISDSSISSTYARRELHYALSFEMRIIPILISSGPSDVPLIIRNYRYLDFRENYPEALSRLIGALKSEWQPKSIEEPPQEPNIHTSAEPLKPANKGYVFISYVGSDGDFVQDLKQFFKNRGYAYWDYRESDREYHIELYRELENRIEEAVAFLCILSDAWRDTLWTAREYIYAEEAGIPVFIIDAKPRKKPTPMVLNLQPRINMAASFEKGLEILDKELSKKGL